MHLYKYWIIFMPIYSIILIFIEFNVQKKIFFWNIFNKYMNLQYNFLISNINKQRERKKQNVKLIEKWMSFSNILFQLWFWFQITT